MQIKATNASKERGFDFAYALRAFLYPKRIIRKDTRWSYGEDRYHLLGAIEHRVFVVVSQYAAALFESFQRVKPISKR